MNENYLNYLCYSGSTINWGTTFEKNNINLVDNTLRTVVNEIKSVNSGLSKTKDVSFIKPPKFGMNFINHLQSKI
jgi:hypothetical protein